MSRVEFGSSSASLQYGILVNLHSLTRAAKAFATFSTDVLSLDLILSRRRRAVAIHSTLVAPPPRVSLQDLPIEILLTIREQLLAVHLSSTPNDFLESHRGFFVADEEYDPDGRPLSLCVCTVTGFGRRCSCVYAEKNAAARARDKALHDQKRDPSKWDQALWDKHEDCDYCLMFVWERVDAAGPIRRLLRAYGLALPSAAIVNAENSDAHAYLVAVTLPSRVHPRSSTSTVLPGFAHSYHPPLFESPVPENLAATLYDPSFLAIAPHDNSKFFRLVSDLDLTVAAASAGGGASVSSATFAKQEEALERKLEASSEMKETSVVAGLAVTPAFMLLHTAEAFDY